MRKKLREFWREWVKPLLIAVAILAPLRSVVADWNDVPSGSMRPTILVGDRIWINKLAYDLKVPFSTIRLCDVVGSATRRHHCVPFTSRRQTARETGCRSARRHD